MNQLLRVAVMAGISLAAATASTKLLQPAPDLMASFLAAMYDAGTGTLTVNGFSDSLTVYQAGVPTLHGISNGSFALTAQINNLGVGSSGTLAINGCIADLPGAPGCSSTLLTSNVLSAFDFVAAPGGELDFAFSALGGDLQPLYGTTALVKMNLIDFPGTFDSSFSVFDFSNVADVGVAEVPEPGTWSLLAIACLALFCCKNGLKAPPGQG